MGHVKDKVFKHLAQIILHAPAQNAVKQPNTCLNICGGSPFFSAFLRNAAISRGWIDSMDFFQKAARYEYCAGLGRSAGIFLGLSLGYAHNKRAKPDHSLWISHASFALRVKLPVFHGYSGRRSPSGEAAHLTGAFLFSPGPRFRKARESPCCPCRPGYIYLM